MPEAAGIQRKLSPRSPDRATAASGRISARSVPAVAILSRLLTAFALPESLASGVVAAVFRLVLPLAAERHLGALRTVTEPPGAQFEFTRGATQCGALRLLRGQYEN